MKSNLNLLFVLILVTGFTGIIWWNGQHNGNINSDAFTDFAVEDTASITKIIITDINGTAVLDRTGDSRYWTLNGEHKARKSSTDLILKTLNRAKVKAAVPSAQRPTVLKNLLTAKRVDIYQGSNSPVKTWFVGTATSNHTGTYMLLEIPGAGRSEEPFVVHMDGFSGFLTTRFFSDVNEWRFTGIFDFPNRSLKSVEVINHNEPHETFTLRADTTGELNLFVDEGLEIGYTDTLITRNQFLLFKKVHFESFNSRLTLVEEIDLKNSHPDYTVTCEGLDGRVARVRIFNLSEEHKYGLTDDGQVVLVQTYVFDPLLKGLSSLLGLEDQPGEGTP
jgi:hypothetical protein